MNKSTPVTFTDYWGGDLAAHIEHMGAVGTGVADMGVVPGHTG